MLLRHSETVVFDPSKKAHRQAVAAYLKRSAWADSPIRFRHDPAFGSVTDLVKTRLVEWYIAREFGNKKNFDGAKELAFALSGISSEYPKHESVEAT